MADLDKEFGECRMSSLPISAREAITNPISLQELSDQTGPELKNLMDSVKTGALMLLKVLFKQFPILWIMNEDGKILFALEEVVDIKTGQLLYPLARKFNMDLLRDKIEKLGHPSLIPHGQEKKARIAGEMYFDEGQRDWIISNRSGRYGLHADVTSEHLNNIAARFKKYNILLTIRHTPTS